MPNDLTTPLTDQAVAGLKAGDEVTITGVLYTARDAAHKRMVQALASGEKLPFDIKGQIIYYVGPTPPRSGQVIGSAGPTTSMRMDALTPPLLEAGLKGIIGKGGRGQAVREALKRHTAIYFGAIGGAGAFLSRHIKKAELVAYEDLGTEAVRRLYVEGFPVIVVNDTYGGDLLEKGRAQWSKDIAATASNPAFALNKTNPLT
ncbi:MAG: Fe-S-containing hydro-lyase [Candidatus Binatia bacterium]